MVEKNTYSVILFIKRGKLLKNGEAPIFLRITVKGERVDISTNQSVDSQSWDSAKGKIKSGAKDSMDRNNYLNNLKLKVQDHKRDIIDKGLSLTTHAIKNAYLGNVQENRGIMDIFLEHNQKCEELSGKDFAPGTVERYTTCRKHIGQFIRWKYHQEDMPVKSIDHQFIKEFEHFLKTLRKCNHNTSVKYIANFKKIIRIALAYNWIKTDPFKNISYRYEQVDPEYLDELELEKVRTRKFSINRIERVRDIFVFCCFTGLAFCDVKSLTKEDISIGKDGRQWIKKKRRKTNKLSSIPLLGVPIGILHSYENDPDCIRTGRLLPVLSNQKMNAYLKEIGDLCGIEKKFTTHTARHTFATTVTLSNNISIEAVSEMLGHSSLKMTKKYARVVDDFLGREMEKIEKKFADKSTNRHDLFQKISPN